MSAIRRTSSAITARVTSENRHRERADGDVAVAEQRHPAVQEQVVAGRRPVGAQHAGDGGDRLAGDRHALRLVQPEGPARPQPSDDTERDEQAEAGEDRRRGPGGQSRRAWRRWDLNGHGDRLPAGPGRRNRPGFGTIGSVEEDLATLESIQRRVLWLAVRMVDHANRERPPGEIKVGGHQASSASMVGIMTALWFGHLSGADKVAVKPHASPVYHAIKYLTGELDRCYLTQLRSLGGLQAYPSRTKDPDVVRLLDRVASASAWWPRCSPPPPAGTSSCTSGRPRPPAFIALGGDAELDEGNVWEAITEPALQGLGNVMLVVDTNRQSLDRVVPDQKIKKLMEFFAGRRLARRRGEVRTTRCRRRSPSPGGDALRAPHRRDVERGVPVAVRPSRRRSCGGASSTAPIAPCSACSTTCADDDVAPLVLDLGGHDLGLLIDSYRACDDVADRPSVVFAYTIKGWGLPIAGDPLNHSAAAVGRPDRRAAGVGRPRRRRRVGPVRPRRARGPAVARRSAAS